MTNPVYMIGMIDVKDYQTYAEQYGMPVGEMFAEVGAEILVATPQVEVLEGEWPGNWTVVVKVPSADIAHSLYHSEKYAPFRKARQEELAHFTTLIVAPALNPTSGLPE